MRLRPDSSINPGTGELVSADGGKLGTFSRGLHRLWWGFFEEPELDLSAPGVADLDEARRDWQAQAEVVDGGTDGLETLPASVNLEGKVIDMAEHRMAQEARVEIDMAHAEQQSTLDEDLQQQTDL